VKDAEAARGDELGVAHEEEVEREDEDGARESARTGPAAVAQRREHNLDRALRAVVRLRSDPRGDGQLAEEDEATRERRARDEAPPMIGSTSS
jgi:hypothetical protein